MRRNNRIVTMLNNFQSENGWSKLREEYLKDMERRGLSEYTIKHDRENLAAISKYLPVDPVIATLTTEQLESQVFDPMRERLAPRTVNGRVKTMRQIMKYAVAHGYAPFNTALGVQRMVEPDDGIPALSEEQIDALLYQCNLKTFTGFRDYAIMSLFLDTGLRLRELSTLTVDQIDLKNHCLREVLGKNRKIENVAVSSQICEVLKQYLIERNCTEVQTNVLFVTVDGKPLNRNTIYRMVKEYGSRAGIEDVRVSPHTFRHSLAKHWILNKGDAFSLQKTLRHKDLNMVKRYVHFFDTELAEMHEEFSPMSKRKLNLSRPRDRK